MRYAFVNCDIYTGEQILYRNAIVINGDKIDSIVELDRVPRDLHVYDLRGVNIAPGFIDVQVNGGGGCLFSDNPAEECIQKMHEAHKRFGTTNFLPTLITSSGEKMLEAIETVGNTLEHSKYGVLGLHLEGPYINEKRAGVHDKKHIRRVSERELDTILSRGRGIVKILTVAPEIVTEPIVGKMREHGILVSAGHTDATYEQTSLFFGWGASAVTHLFNAMSAFNGREPGVVGASLDSAKTWAGIIVDGIHVHFSSVRICKKIKGDKLILVTDAMPPVGAQITSFKLGELEVMCADGKCTTKDGTLAGSALNMATAVRNCVHQVGIPLQEALRMASTYPAQLLGHSQRLGMIKPGYEANLVAFNNQLVVSGVVVRGKYESFS